MCISSSRSCLLFAEISAQPGPAQCPAITGRERHQWKDANNAARTEALSPKQFQLCTCTSTFSCIHCKGCMCRFYFWQTKRFKAFSCQPLSKGKILLFRLSARAKTQCNSFRGDGGIQLAFLIRGRVGEGRTDVLQTHILHTHRESLN